MLLPGRSVETSIVPSELEDVDPGDGVVYFRPGPLDFGLPSAETISRWLRCGAASVEVRRYLVNKYRRPGMSNRDVDLGGAAEAASVLYVFTIKAPR